jgi:hypothetical protein
MIDDMEAGPNEHWALRVLDAVGFRVEAREEPFVIDGVFLFWPTHNPRATFDDLRIAAGEPHMLWRRLVPRQGPSGADPYGEGDTLDGLIKALFAERKPRDEEKRAGSPDADTPPKPLPQRQVKAAN